MNPIKKIKEFFKKKKEKTALYEYNSGYDYAAGAILRKEETPHDIDMKINWISFNKFDSGAVAAINDLVALGTIKDNRV